MRRSTIAVGLLLLVLIQCALVDGWWFRRRRPRRCRYPKSGYGNYGYRSDYFYGSTSLFGGKKWWGKRSFRVSTLTLRHSLLMFRGKIFEWGLGKPKSYLMSRSLCDSKIRWSWGSKGSSRCKLGDAETWTRRYPYRYGKYKLFGNNCHHFVNRLVRYLNTNCGR